MASITIRNLSTESKERLRHNAEQRGCSLEALAQSILDAAAEAPVPVSDFPHDLISLVEPGTDIESFINEHDQPQSPVNLPRSCWTRTSFPTTILRASIFNIQ